MGEITHWNPGDEIILRGVWNNKVWFAQSLNMVEDSDDLIVVYCRAGNPQMSPKERITPSEFLSITDLELVESTWTRTNMLILIKPGEMYSIYVMWDAQTGKQDCWYINIQEPILRTEIGIDTNDLALDIVVYPDKKRWYWKDEDEFNEMVRLGIYSKEYAKEIREAGERALQLLFENKPPFCDGWENWEPPIVWPTPKLSPEWDMIK